ncbi:MAG: cyclic nucleotide-binding domain-containing protein [Gammaproteobacteria bacterium]|nr:cyclic nucleotide-binding domain-containing protein [Gammaproteobacteria bacterium]MDE2345805.1 cyclic nucleotide-binding domain-containing protein [Gammaproteobacteria bacterium]
MGHALNKKPAFACSHCRLSKECLPGSVGIAQIPELERYIRPLGPLHRGDHLYRAGDPNTSLYIVQSGCFKLYGVDPVGREYILGFRLPGAVLGQHSFVTGTHQFNALALSPSMVCRLNAVQLNELVERVPRLLSTLLHMVGQKLASDMFLSGNFSAEERIAAFLAHFQEMISTGDDLSELNLPMSRGDIAVYLHLASATVSRTISRLQQESIIESDYHHIRILDMKRLASLCSNVPFARMRL